MKKLKRWFIVLLMIIIVFIGYVEIVNMNSGKKTYRQKILKATYPALMWVNKITGKKTKMIDNDGLSQPAASLYSLSVHLNNGQELPLQTLKGKKILFVNTASDCGYTSQYEDLEKLYQLHKDKLVIIAFPANNFKEQEKGTDEEIAKFCKVNYGISFPLAKKSSVIKGNDQNEIFRWLTDKDLNGWNEQQPTWNFSKYLVDDAGNLLNYFDPGVSPMGTEIKSILDK